MNNTMIMYSLLVFCNYKDNYTRTKDVLDCWSLEVI